MFTLWSEHSPGQQRESERSAWESSCSEQARTETKGRAGGDRQQPADTTGFEEKGNLFISALLYVLHIAGIYRVC